MRSKPRVETERKQQNCSTARNGSSAIKLRSTGSGAIAFVRERRFCLRFFYLLQNCSSMSRDKKLLLLLLLLAAMLPLGCRTRVESRNRFEENRFPSRILWVWERPEDLEFLDAQQFAVAFLAQTLTLKNDDVLFSPRRQPLKVSPEVKLIAVTRIESQKTTGAPTALSEAQRKKLVDLVLKTLDLRNVSAVQIDFDAVVSEREFYRSLLTDLRQKLPNNTPLSMTALASFC